MIQDRTCFSIALIEQLVFGINYQIVSILFCSISGNAVLVQYPIFLDI